MARKKIKSAKDVIGAVRRTFDILEIVACHDSSIRITEISRKAELPKSAVHRILSTLISLGYIRQDKDTKKYDIGPKASYLANILERKMNLSLQARQFLIELVERCKETVNLGILDWSKVLYLDTIEGPQAMRMASQKGKTALIDRVKAEVKHVFKTHKPESLDTKLIKYLEEIAKKDNQKTD